MVKSVSSVNDGDVSYINLHSKECVSTWTLIWDAAELAVNYIGVGKVCPCVCECGKVGCLALCLYYNVKVYITGFGLFEVFPFLVM